MLFVSFIYRYILYIFFKSFGEVDEKGGRGQESGHVVIVFKIKRMSWTYNVFQHGHSTENSLITIAQCNSCMSCNTYNINCNTVNSWIKSHVLWILYKSQPCNYRASARKGIMELDPFRKHRRKIWCGLLMVKCKIWTDSRKITQMHSNVWKSYTHLLI